MNTFASVMTQLFKVGLMVLGFTMLLGGGACAIFDLNYGFQTSFNEYGLVIGFTLLSIVTAVAGWFIMKYTLSSMNKSENSGE